LPKKPKEIKTIHSPTKRQLSKWQRQKKQQRLLMIIAGAFIALILAISGFGYWDNAIRPYNEKALKINGKEFTTGYFLDTMRYYAQGMGQDDLPRLINYSAQAITEGELIRQAAPRLGMMPTDEEVKTLETQYGLGGKPAYKDLALTTVIANNMIMKMFDKEVPQNAEQAQVQAMVLESANIASDVAGQLHSGGDFSNLAKQFSIEQTTKAAGGDVGWIVRDMEDAVPASLAGTIVPRLAFELKPGEMSQPVFDDNYVKKYGYWIYKVTERDADVSVRAYGILLGSKDEAKKVKAELDNGIDFTAAVQKYSLDENSKQNDGDLGWKQKKAIPAETANLLFSLPLNTISDPLLDNTTETKGGWWIVKVVNHETDRALDSETRSILVQQVFNDWLIKEQDAAHIELLLEENQQLWLYSQISMKRTE
jgi:parvulin-like peptidyl-prolyl isomerase